ncbi:carboxypeptidase-like regulatory domain-containing protein [Pedobacter sp. N36a]|uniref:DUF5686 family protein n=1 Tax=Pedobacter sp. N36a TaxID=2767996 RepID=UPI0016575218|nr:DUF5686 family protein [Pedobacter sp. N36a]MBC8986803.1 carboxypeptidase-like regulatory domain-containing protein [Pedobacter sp. N36a]
MSLKSTLVIFLSFLAFYSNAQRIAIKGRITDKATGLPLTHINVGFDNKAPQTLSDAYGRYSMIATGKEEELYFSMIGYKKQVISLIQTQGREINIQMEPQSEKLSEVSIKGANKAKYRNTNNPAVDFMRQVIDHKTENNANGHKEISYKQYEKINMSISIPSDKAGKIRLLKKLPFLLENSDSLKVPGKKLIPVLIQEKFNQVRFSALSGDTVLKLGEKQSRIDQYLDEDGINEYLEKIYQGADLYDNDVGLGNQRFLSPIAGMATSFYKYFIVDTLKDVSPRQLKIMVAPKNKQDVLFLGYLFITLDGNYALKRAELSINNQINLNWVKDLQIILDYDVDGSGRYHLGKGVMSMDLGIFREGTSIFGERTIITHDFLYGPEALSRKIDAPLVGSKLNDDSWLKLRPEPLALNDKIAYQNIDSLKQSKIFLRKMAFASFLLSGFIPAGKLEFGPISSFYSFNPVEGSRFKFAGRTTEALSKKVFLDAHLAYGTKDQKWKYSLGTVLSLTDKSIYQFPVKSITLKHSYETQIPGQELNFLEDDNVLLSFKRGSNNKWLYNKKWLIEYLHETSQHLSFKLSYKNQVLKSAGDLFFQRGSQLIPDLNSSEFLAEIRWAPNEKFYQGKRYRRQIVTGQPVFTLRGAIGIKDFLGGDYNYQNISLNISKRFYLSVFGYSDVIFEAGAVFGKVPFPLLHIHRANQTFAYQLSSYNLMNFMEFLSDRYYSVNLQHSFNGFFLNKVPLIKKMQWREIVSLKVLGGTISSGNDPGKNAELFRFPTNEQGRPFSHPLGHIPYVEGSIGVSNIFKILRVDLVRRFTYLENPEVTRWGIRAKFNVDF